MTRRLVLILVGTASAIVALDGRLAVVEAQAARSVKEGVYSAAQSEAGKAAYTKECASCHGQMTSTTPDMAPLLNDWIFQEKWKAKSVGDLFERIRTTMPQNKEGTLSPESTAEIVAYILSANQLPAGDRPLPTVLETLSQIRLDAAP